MTDPTPHFAPPPSPAHRLSSREQVTATELGRRSPQLESLFRSAIQLSREPTNDSSAYLLAHAARELSRGFLAERSGGAVGIGEQTDDQAGEGSRSALRS